MRSVNFLHNQRIVDRWSNRTSEPDYDSRYYEHCSCCGLEIYENPFKIDGELLCEDCATETCREWLCEEESIECEGCGELITDDECYYKVSDDAYCESCFRIYFKE